MYPKAFSSQEDMKKIQGDSLKGSLRVLTTTGRYDIIRKQDLGRHIMAGYVVAVFPSKREDGRLVRKYNWQAIL